MKQNDTNENKAHRRLNPQRPVKIRSGAQNSATAQGKNTKKTGTQKKGKSAPKRSRKSRREDAMMVALLCVLALVLAAAVGAGAFWLLRSRKPAEEELPLPNGDVLLGEAVSEEQAEKEFAESGFETKELKPLSSRGTRIPVTVTVDPQGEQMPLVVLCHGFTGNRDGDGHFEPLAKMLARAGIATVRLDFPGCGESEEPFTDYTLDRMFSDVDTVVDFICSTYSIDESRIGLLGHSMGGRVATRQLSSCRFGVAALALWSPANNEGLSGLEFLKRTPEEREAMRAEVMEQGTYDLPNWGVTIGAEFVTQMASGSPNHQLAGYHGPLLLSFAGGDEDLLSRQTIDSTLAAAAERGEEFVNLTPWFGNSNHNYNGTLDDDYEVEGRRIAALIENATAKFFIEHLTDKTVGFSMPEAEPQEQQQEQPPEQPEQQEQVPEPESSEPITEAAEPPKEFAPVTTPEPTPTPTPTLEPQPTEAPPAFLNPETGAVTQG